MIDRELMCECECPACGEMLFIYEMGRTECDCGMTVATVQIEWETIEGKDYEKGRTDEKIDS